MTEATEINAGVITGLIALAMLICFVVGRHIGIEYYQEQLLKQCESGNVFTIDKSVDLYSCYNASKFYGSE